MIILLIAFAIIAVYAWLFHIATTADRKAQGHASPVSATTTQTSILAGDDLIDTDFEGETWTTLDDHQLNRLLKESATPSRRHLPGAVSDWDLGLYASRYTGP